MDGWHDGRSTNRSDGGRIWCSCNTARSECLQLPLRDIEHRLTLRGVCNRWEWEEIRPIFDAIIGEPLPEDGVIRLGDAPGFGVELNRGILEPFGDTVK